MLKEKKANILYRSNLKNIFLGFGCCHEKARTESNRNGNPRLGLIFKLNLRLDLTLTKLVTLIDK